jgi:UDP-N-acetyl-D-mannosaminuronate dehydrogenase
VTTVIETHQARIEDRSASIEIVDPGPVGVPLAVEFARAASAVQVAVTPPTSFGDQALYKKAVVKVLPVSSPRVAEMAKLLENIYRNVNIALVNELTMRCDRMTLDA